MAQNTRQDWPAKRVTTHPVKGFCRFIKSGTGCHHIINQHHGLIGNAMTLVLWHGKRAC